MARDWPAPVWMPEMVRRLPAGEVEFVVVELALPEGIGMAEGLAEGLESESEGIRRMWKPCEVLTPESDEAEEEEEGAAAEEEGLEGAARAGARSGRKARGSIVAV